ncbi:hypothetical protein [Parablautia muri]|nr:hypothetical protein [Parablautia muri]
MAENEYRYNKAFRDFVDGYCAEHGTTVEEALQQDEVKHACLYYTDV